MSVDAAAGQTTTAIGFFGILFSSVGAAWLIPKQGADEVARLELCGRRTWTAALFSGVVAAAFVAVLISAVRGVTPAWFHGALLPLTFIGTFAAGMHAIGKSRCHRYYGFWIVVLASILSLPTLGSFGLIDPWEAHYGEVAREMLARRDWISTWWGHEGWFMSKPVLLFWLQAISMSLFGVHHEPGRVLEGAAGQIAHPEWALRFPIFLLSTMALYAFYKSIAFVAGRRAGFFAAVVLCTAPHWFFIGHQSVTDMPLVASMTIAMAFALAAIHTKPTAQVGLYAVRFSNRVLHLHAVHGLIALVVLVVLPQILYLLTRNIELQRFPNAIGFRLHADEFFQGSTGNCDLPGQPNCGWQSARYPTLQPALQAAIWLAVLGLVLLRLRNQRNRRSSFILFAWVFSAIATMAKGPVGFVLPAAVFVSFVIVSRRWNALLSMEMLTGSLLFVAMVGPWYVALYARHGMLFLDELVFRHMLGRTLQHMHDTNEGEDLSFRYYISQLGYGIFPWVALLPASLAAAMTERDSHRRSSSFFLIWVFFAFALVSRMLTKFHHYILPAVPPIAALIGVTLDRYWRMRSTDRYDRKMFIGLGLAGVLLMFLVARDLVLDEGTIGQSRWMSLFTYFYKRDWPSSFNFRPALISLSLIFSAAATALVVLHRSRAALVALLTTATAFAVFGIHIYLFGLAPHWGQRQIFEDYFPNRTSEPLIAYRLNWKGENFYAGNRLAIISAVEGTPRLYPYVEQRTHAGVNTFFFVLERTRISTLRHELKHIVSFEVLTEAKESAKFCLVRAVLDAH